MPDHASSERLARLLGSYSIEITARDTEARRAVLQGMPLGAEVFVADLPDQPPEVMRDAVAELRRGGLDPVPHLVARNVAGRPELDRVVAELRRVGQIDKVLVTAGDREAPAGPFASALELMREGVLQRHGITRLAFPCFPEGHPLLPASRLEAALRDKLAAAAAAGFAVLLLTQFAFAAQPVVAFVHRLRRSGIDAPLRVGAAGPAERGRLVEFGRDLGVGPSLARLERPDAPDDVPDRFLREIAAADPGLGICGAHLFPFGSTAECVAWVEARRRL